MLEGGCVHGRCAGLDFLLAVGFQPRLTTSFFLGLFRFDASLARFKSLAGLVGFYLFGGLLAHFCLGITVVLHQRDMAGAHIGAGAALDAVHQVVVLGLIQVVILGVPVELLGQQVGRAHVGAGATADAGLLRGRLGQFFQGGGDDAVGGFHHRHCRVVQGEAHHRAAHDQTADVVRIHAAVQQQIAYRGAQQHLHITRLTHAFAGERGHPRQQWLAVDHRSFDGIGGAHVLAHHAHLGR